MEKFSEMMAKIRARQMEVPCHFDLSSDDEAVDMEEETAFDFDMVDPGGDVEGQEEAAGRGRGRGRVVRRRGVDVHYIYVKLHVLIHLLISTCIIFIK